MLGAPDSSIVKVHLKSKGQSPFLLFVNVFLSTSFKVLEVFLPNCIWRMDLWSQVPILSFNLIVYQDDVIDSISISFAVRNSMHMSSINHVNWNSSPEFRETSIFEYSSLKRISRKLSISWENYITVHMFSGSHWPTVFTCTI